ncbi:MAG: pyruvate kinase [Sulfuriferula sp.]
MSIVANSIGEINAIMQEVMALRAAIIDTQATLLVNWNPYLQNPNYLPSAANLGAYIGLRRTDLRELQNRLARVGLSSLGRCETHVLATLDAVSYALAMMDGATALHCPIADINHTMTHEQSLRRKNTVALFPRTDNKLGTLMMVTMPSEAANDFALVYDMINAGMDCSRINCSHDDEQKWANMVTHIRRASKVLKRDCLIMFDLAGPKLRTGEMLPEPPILHIKIKRDQYGDIMSPTEIILDGTGNLGTSARIDPAGKSHPARLSVPAKWLQRLKVGDTIKFHDAGKRKREFIVSQCLVNNEVVVTCTKGAYIAPGTVLKHVSNKYKDNKITTGEFNAPPARIHVEKNDVILLMRALQPGQTEQRDKHGNITLPARIACTAPEIFEFIQAGHAVWIDDGRIGCLIEEIDAQGAWLRVTQVKPGGEHIAAEKGLNFPDSKLALPALTEKDISDLDFVAQHADMVGLSFTQQAEDVGQLRAALTQRNAGKLGIVAKIETHAAVKNLPEIIVRGAGKGAFGIMIARGDLAVEIGYERLAEIQEEILWLCEAAHIPVIWATQVLESLVKQGLPSRAEITDAAMSERAECVMLNKGPYIVHGISMLNSIITRMQAHQDKKTPQYRALHW